MACEQSKRIGMLLTGALGSSETLAVLDHAKTCENCREMLTERAKIASAVDSADGTRSDAMASCGARSAPSFRVGPQADSELFERWTRAPARNHVFRRSIGLALIAASVLFMLRFTNIGGGKVDAGSFDALFAVAALESGRPAVISPVGVVGARPMALGGWLPAGNDTVELVVVRAAGVVFRQRFSARDHGVDFEERKLEAGGRRMGAVEILLPFPSPDELEIPAGIDHFCYLRLSNGQESAPRAFRLD